MKRYRNLLIILFSFVCTLLQARENVFYGWFDIQAASPAGTEVTGRIHLERNKDVRTSPVPDSWHFELAAGETSPFTLETRRDLAGRLMGVFTLNDAAALGKEGSVHRIPVQLMDGEKVLESFETEIHVLGQTLWSLFYERYFPETLKEGRLYGSKKLSDAKAEKLIAELEKNGGRFKGFSCYEQGPVAYKAATGKSIANDWVAAATNIGNLGYVYCTSEIYGPEGDPAQHERLKKALYEAILQYTASMTVYGDEVLIDGKPIGDKVGDGFSLLTSHDLLSHGDGTHHWRFTDPMIVPCLALIPDILAGAGQGDEQCLQLHESLIRYFQIFMSIVEVRRVIDNPDERWGALVDTTYSAGAWADANLGHRSRTMLALPLIWGDYNRPLTYVPYWYTDYYGGKPFEGFSFSTGWSPHGVLFDVNRWMTKYGIPSHHYVQSGFHPDGTISHHVGHGTDAAMVAYGFEWLTDCSAGFSYFKDTPFQVAAEHYQFQLDKLLDVYPAFFYKGSMDFLIAGRSHLSDMHKFATSTYPKAVRALDKARGKGMRLERMDSLKTLTAAIKDGTYERSLTQAYWVNEYLIHRRGEEAAKGGLQPFFASVKLKSQRTVGIEDFSKVRKSWHGGSGILTVKVNGDEYSYKVLSNMDWHALPGLTEEWRTDPLPAEGGSQAALPGANKVAGVLADGIQGMAIYHHLPQETYSSATALKSYHFVEDCIAAAGSQVRRYREGQGKDIMTFVDQSRFDQPLTLCIKGKTTVYRPGESVTVNKTIQKPVWLHHGKKGYVIVPQHKIGLTLRFGNEVNVTDPEIADGTPNYIIALDHGNSIPRKASKPGCSTVLDDGYLYFIIPNVEAGDMPQVMDRMLGDAEITMGADSVHTFRHNGAHVHQFAFFKAAKADDGQIAASADAPAMLQMKEWRNSWLVTMGNPAPDGIRQTLTFTVSEKLKPGTYTWYTAGTERFEGETVTVTSCKEGSRITVELPDIRDEKKYRWQTDLYAASPITVEIPKL